MTYVTGIHPYRVVVVRKQIDVTCGQQRLFEDPRYFFYIANAPREGK